MLQGCADSVAQPVGVGAGVEMAGIHDVIGGEWAFCYLMEVLAPGGAAHQDDRLAVDGAGWC